MSIIWERGAPYILLLEVARMKAGLVVALLMNGVTVIVPVAVGLIVKVLGDEELFQVTSNGVKPALPVPANEIVVVPVNVLFGVNVKLVDDALTEPEVGPVMIILDGVQAPVEVAVLLPRAVPPLVTV